MVRKSLLLVMLLAFVFLASGCVTIYTEKACVDCKSDQCMKKTAKPKTEEGPGIVKKADNWVKDNLW
jgi:hypothetical protein